MCWRRSRRRLRETVGLRAEGKRVRSGTSARSIAWGAEWVAAVTELGRRRKGRVGVVGIGRLFWTRRFARVTLDPSFDAGTRPQLQAVGGAGAAHLTAAIRGDASGGIMPSCKLLPACHPASTRLRLGEAFSQNLRQAQLCDIFKVSHPPCPSLNRVTLLINLPLTP